MAKYSTHSLGMLADTHGHLAGIGDKQADLLAGRASLVRGCGRSAEASVSAAAFVGPDDDPAAPRVPAADPFLSPIPLQPELSEVIGRLIALFPSKGRAGRLDWAAAGAAFAPLMFDAPALSVMLGPLRVPVKEKAASNAAAKREAALKAGVLNPAQLGPGGKPVKDNSVHQVLREAEVVQRAEAQNAAKSKLIFEQLSTLHHRRPDLVRSGVLLEGVDRPATRPLIRLIPALFDAFSYTQTVRAAALRCAAVLLCLLA